MARRGRVAWGMWDVQGVFQNATEKAVLERCQKSEQARRWSSYIEDFFRAREFTMEWEGAVRGRGKTNVGAPQGSPLSPVILIFMAPILEAMEDRIRTVTRLDVELPSYVDDFIASISDPRGRRNMDQVMDRVDGIVNEVAMEWNLPLEPDKTERIVFRTKGKGKRKDAKWAKWLGIIVDEDLLFDHHWKSRIAKARKLLGTISGLGNSNWGISPGSWRQIYTGVIRVVALWGAKLGWRGQKNWRLGTIEEEIVDSKRFPCGVKYLIRWEGYGEDENTWGPIEIRHRGFSAGRSKKLNNKRGVFNGRVFEEFRSSHAYSCGN